jgi:HD-GYP domain-containing protein (c-di-GMP phosphodiesterase class II)
MKASGTAHLYYLPDPDVERFVGSRLAAGTARRLPDASDGPGVVLTSAAEAQVAAAAGAKAQNPALEIVVLLDPAGPAPAAAHDAVVHAYLAADAPPTVVARTLAGAREHAWIRAEHARAKAESARLARDLQQLNQIGVRLSSEHDLDALLDLILTRAREITRSDAGSLYLVDRDATGQPCLRFALTQNDSVAVPFREVLLPMTSASVAGYVAVTAEPVRLDDAYALPPDATYRINRQFDEKVGYRTKSVLAVPMRTSKNETIGVLQLINRKASLADRFTSPADIEARALPFSPELEGLAASLASQAAVAVENAWLYHSIQNLFEGFVRASVVAIEARDPTTSGHSFRVAELTVALAEVVDRVATGPYAAVHFQPAHIREIRYASLLHDFGKVGVPERVLVKAKKLDPEQVQRIQHRVEQFKAGLALRSALGRVDEAEVAATMRLLDRYLHAAITANEPSLLAAPVAAILDEMVTRTFEDYRGVPGTVITPEEARILSVRQGSLTEEERARIQEHVIHTFRFLSQIPWTADLERVPEIARSHHERLDGAGYPYGLKAADIPLQSRMMTIADVYDALTAADRPYKRAVPPARALEILEAEARAGAIDETLLGLFIDEKIFLRGSTASPRTDIA